MEIIIQPIISLLMSVGPLIVLLGILIFVHEAGHFLTAKYFGVRVETFSLGFGKKILQKKVGDTTYCLSLIPLGGYVKMYGDDPTKDVPEDQKKYSFLHQPLLPRMLIVLAGPMVNFFFAVIIFALVVMIGENLPNPTVGDIEPGTQAHKAGFQSGDHISKINDQNIISWLDVDRVVKESPQKNLKFSVQREDKTVDILVTPEYGENNNIISFDEKVGVIGGLSISSKEALVGVSNPESPAFKAGIPSVINVESINDTKTPYWRSLAQALRKYNGQTLNIKYNYFLSEKPTTETKAITNWSVSADASDEEILKSLGFDQTDLYLYKIKKGSPASEAGLLPGDKIVSLDGKNISGWSDILKVVSSYKNNAPPIDFGVLRSGQLINLKITPEMTELLNNKFKDEQRFTVGIVPAIGYVGSGATLVRNLNPLSALVEGTRRSIKWTGLTALGIVKLLQNKVSSRNVTGIIGIGRVASQSFEIGMSAFLKMMAIISINLFFLNLLPVPVLDGGHLLIFSIEAIKGKPISLKKLEIAQTFGLVVLLSLMAFSFFNDITNLYTSLSW